MDEKLQCPPVEEIRMPRLLDIPAAIAQDLELPLSMSPRDRVVRGIIEGLYSGGYLPGERLVEADLTREFGISRGPVREGLNRLAAMGVVSLTPGRGAEIRKLTLREAINILVVVQAIVGLAAGIAAEQVAAGRIAADLDDALAQLHKFKSSKQSAEYAWARENFYRTLTMIGGNDELARVLAGLQSHLVRVQFGGLTASVDRYRLRDYRTISIAVLSGKPSAARKAAEAHIARTLEILRSILTSS